MFKITPLFEAGYKGYYTFRIPAIVTTASNTVLAFCAARHSRGGDWDPIDIMLRRSPDGGATWEEARVLAGNEPDGLHTFDNPTPIVDRQSGAIHFLHQIDYERAYYLRSDDEGKTWSAPRDITDVFEAFRPDYNWKVLAPGPGHAIQLKNGRLLVPVWLSTGEGTEFGPGKRGHRPSCVATIYSDDGGATWQRGDIVVHHAEEIPNPSETLALQRHDGPVLLNIRNESPRHRRLISISEDGATGWSPPQFHDELFEPICMASLIRLSQEPQGRNRILFANPDSQDNPATVGGRAHRRENVTVRLSYDEGQSWPVSKVLDPGDGGYSDLAVGPDGTIYCLYEGGARGGNQYHNTRLAVARFDLTWLTDGKDSL